MNKKVQVSANKNEIENLIRDTWEKFVKVKNDRCVVENSIPILWFGNLPAYMQSKRRIVTIGLNPSNKEFECNRFPAADCIRNKKKLSATDILSYSAAMNEYFIKKPYTRWFNRYETILNHLNSSYYNNTYGNQSIHIDIYSPIATNPTWGKLHKTEKALVKSPAFNSLIELLKPKVLLISANKEIVKQVFGDNDWKDNYKKNNYYIKTFKRGQQLIIWGSNLRGTPFGPFNNKELTDVMRKIQLSL